MRPLLPPDSREMPSQALHLVPIHLPELLMSLRPRTVPHNLPSAADTDDDAWFCYRDIDGRGRTGIFRDIDEVAWIGEPE